MWQFSHPFPPFHLHSFSHAVSSWHLLIFTSSRLSHLLICTPSHLHICSPWHLLSLHLLSHLLIFTPHILIFTLSLTRRITFTSSFILSLSLSPVSVPLFSLSPSLSFYPFARNVGRSAKISHEMKFDNPKQRLNHNFTSLEATLSHDMRVGKRKLKKKRSFLVTEQPFQMKWFSIVQKMN